jgi:uncharacterized protein (TIGR02145 family)
VSDTRGICPIGWRVPSVSDWNTLFHYLDPSFNISNQNIIANGILGEALRTTSNDFWYASLNPTNVIGFSAISHPIISSSGVQNNLSFSWADYWTSTQVSTVSSQQIHMFEDGGNFLESYPALKNEFFNIRCIKE